MLRIARKHPRISVNPQVMVGKPCIKGTRIPVDLILRYVGGGASFAEITEAYPGITAEDIRACVDFAADVVADEAVVLADA